MSLNVIVAAVEACVISFPCSVSTLSCRAATTFVLCWCFPCIYLGGFYLLSICPYFPWFFFCPSFPVIFPIIVLFFIVLHLSKQRSVSSVDNTNGFWCGAWLCCAPAHGATIVSSIICCGRGWWVLLYSPDASLLWSYIGWVTPFYI